MSGLPQIPDDDADFTPELARKIIAEYQRRERLQQSQFANCHKEIFRLREMEPGDPYRTRVVCEDRAFRPPKTFRIKAERIFSDGKPRSYGFNRQ